MLRRIASRTLREPVARATSPGPQPTATSAAVLAHQYQLLQQQQHHQPQVLQQQSRGLSSSVLLSSTRDAYESKKVAELKSELKSRGLTSTGRKDELVKRLVNSDSLINGSTLNLASPPQLRKKSTLASLRNQGDGKKVKDAPGSPAPAGNKSNVAPPSAASHGGVKTNRGTPPSANQSAKTSDKESEPAPIVDPETAKAVANAEKPLGSMKLADTPASLEAGRVHNAAADGLASDATAKASPGAVDESGPAKKTTPPGLPPHKAPQAKETFNIQIPYYPDPPVPGPEIPVVTSYTSPHLKQSEPQDTSAKHEEPKAISVSASSAISHASDMSSHDSKTGGKEQVKGVIAELVSDLQAQSGNEQIVHAASETAGKSIESAKSALSSVTEQAKSVIASAAKEVSDVAAKAQPSGSGSGSKSGSSSSPKKSSRPLNDHERTGVYVLLGIVSGGLVLGGINKPSKGKKKKAEESAKQQEVDSPKKEGVKAVTIKPVSPVAAVAQGDGGAAQTKPSGSSVQAPAGSKVKAPIMCVPKGTQLSSSGTGAPSTLGGLAYNATTLSKLAQLSSCEVSDALLKLKVSTGGFLPGIELYSPARLEGDTRICGPAYTVKMVSQSDTDAPKPKSHFVDAAVEYPDHVMVVQAPSNTRSAVWGGLMTARAQYVGLQGVILDGRCRDLAEHREAHFPVFARGHSTVGQSPFTRPSELQVPITISDPTALSTDERKNPVYPSLTVNPGDLVLADVDGVVVIPPAHVEDVIRLALKGRTEDANCLKDIKNGVPVKEAFAKNRSK